MSRSLELGLDRLDCLIEGDDHRRTEEKMPIRI